MLAYTLSINFKFSCFKVRPARCPLCRTNEPQNLNVNQLNAKMKSKKELCNFLLQDCQANLPPMDATNVYFLKQVKRGGKEVGALQN